MAYRKLLGLTLAQVLILTFVVTGVSAYSIHVLDGHITHPGNSTTVSVVLDTAPDTVIGYYSMNFSVADPAVADISAAEFPSWIFINTTTPLPAGTLRVTALNMMNETLPSLEDVVLVNLTLTAKECGATVLSPESPYMEYPGGELNPGDFEVFGGDVVIGVTGDFYGSPTEGNAPLSVKFHDLSSGGANAWQWEFKNDGVIGNTTKDPVYTYQQPGVYSVKLSVSNGGCWDTVVKEDYITVHEAPPIAEFSADPKTGSVPLTVHFSDLSTGTPGTWAWTFGDGGTSDLQNPEYIYDTVGIYNVTLRVANALGNSTLTKNGYIDVKSPGAPVAAFTASPLSGALPLTVYFTDESTGESTTWLWDFGDDVTSGEKDPVHTYTKGGHFSVRLTAANSAGESTVEKPDLIYITGSPSPTRTPFIPVTTPVTPVVPIESPATPVEPIETSATPVVPIETPVTPVEPIETSTTPVVPIETPVTPVEPIETPVNPSPGPGGVMWVVSNPGSAAIYVDGEYMGTTLPFPLVKVITVASGLHEIMMAYEGYQPWTGTVDLSSLFPVLVYGELTPIV